MTDNNNTRKGSLILNSVPFPLYLNAKEFNSRAASNAVSYRKQYPNASSPTSTLISLPRTVEQIN